MTKKKKKQKPALFFFTITNQDLNHSNLINKNIYVIRILRL